MLERERQFRRICGAFATGVTVLLTRVGNEVHGMTANAFMSVSLEPLLVAVALNSRGRMSAILRESGRPFTISILNGDQQWLSETFSKKSSRLVNPVRGIVSAHGLPVIADSLGYLVCEMRAMMPVGDHSMVIAEIMDCEEGMVHEPLIFYRSAYYHGLNQDQDREGEGDFLLLER